ncbi:MAG: NAD(P)H-dependent glycerol-3-phosphate dehydrogenase [Terriglobales bacterium]
MNRRTRVGVLGAGSWGTALALVLERQGHEVPLWVYEADLARGMAQARENAVFLPGFRLPPAILPTTEMSALGTDVVVVAVPSHALRTTLERLLPHLLPDSRLVLATKGLEQHSLLRVSEVAAQVVGVGAAERLATLSGPTFAREIAAGEPAAVVIASQRTALAQDLQQRLSSSALRLYTSSDVIGVELGAALKNVIAIAAGICQGLGLGSNTRAALIARGLAEMTRLTVAAGGQPETLAGLAGLGDLVLTCTGDLSRNRAVGMGLGQGRALSEILAATPMVAEGVQTTAAAHELAQRLRVDMPITAQMRQVLFDGKPPLEAVQELMLRALKPEREHAAR